MGGDPSGTQQVEDLLRSGIVVTDVVDDSRRVTPGSLYVCLRGTSFDGHDFAGQAVADGAVALLVDHLVDAPAIPVAQIVVDDTRVRVGPIAALLAGHPSRSLTTVGITGTNGKTTTAQFLEAIFNGSGRPTGVVGTLHGPRTTPEAADLQRTLRGFLDDGCDAAVLEVSSHALALHRVDGTEFDAVVFTNLGHDHLDLHGSQEEYFRAKARLFSPALLAARRHQRRRPPRPPARRHGAGIRSSEWWRCRPTTSATCTSTQRRTGTAGTASRSRFPSVVASTCPTR